ncbi:MAG: hypothetical protein KAI77_03225 [Gammaproteobacteria bacterium]|nr:hypothetical protein [Gammaproteobacteria bacterium]
MFRNAVNIIVALLILSGCAGGLSGVVSSSFPGKWLVYKVSYPEDGRKLEQSAEEVLDNQLFNQGFKKSHDWRRPWFSNVRVATFKQKYRGHYIRIDAEISQELIIIMSTSYSDVTKRVFDTLESALIEIFGESSVEECFGTKDIYGHSCFNTPSGR